MKAGRAVSRDGGGRLRTSGAGGRAVRPGARVTVERSVGRWRTAWAEEQEGKINESLRWMMDDG